MWFFYLNLANNDHPFLPFNRLFQLVIEVLLFTNVETLMKIEHRQLLKTWRDELGGMMRVHYVLSAPRSGY